MMGADEDTGETAALGLHTPDHLSVDRLQCRLVEEPTWIASNAASSKSPRASPDWFETTTTSKPA
jgi:hypothetical protein